MIRFSQGTLALELGPRTPHRADAVEHQRHGVGHVGGDRRQSDQEQGGVGGDRRQSGDAAGQPSCDTGRGEEGGVPPSHRRNGASSVTINAVPAPDRLPERLRRCVDQTIAAEALEGWHPTADHIDALIALVNDDVTFDDYLAEYRTCYPPGPTRRAGRRTYHRRRPYLIPGTTVLRNNFGADTHAMLADLEFVSTAGRIAGWHRRLTDGDVSADDLDIRMLHQQLFAEVYAWAGHYRVTELRLGDDVFASRSSVQPMMDRLEESARAVVADYSGRTCRGPGRRIRPALRRLQPHSSVPRRQRANRHDDAAHRRRAVRPSSRPQRRCRARSGMPHRTTACRFARDGRADHRPFLPLFVRAIS